MKITAHVLVKNEARFIWFSVMSVLPYVDRVRLWDTGSNDGTLEIIREIEKQPEALGKIYSHKENMEKFDEELVRQRMLEQELDEFGLVGQKMLDVTRTDWFLVVDADEIWWDRSIKIVTDFIRKEGSNFESIVVPTINLVGDMFHYQEKQAGKYNLAGREGHYNLRGVNRSIPGLKSLGEHGIWGWVDEDNNMIQNRNSKKIKFLDAPYLHATHLPRSMVRSEDLKVLKRGFKYKHELGLSFPLDYYYPEVLFRFRPNIVPSPWSNITLKYKFRAYFATPLRKIKRRYLPTKIGY